MKIPFSIDEFLDVFENYNLSLWPIQILFYVLALISIVAILKSTDKSSRIVMYILTFFWFWMGIVYHIIYFSSINKAAYLFGIIFLVQGFVFLYVGVMKQKIQFKFSLDLPGLAGLVLIFYSLILYPIIGYFGGHIYPRTPTFGVPCPTTIFTFGVLLYSTKRIPFYVLVIPLLWSLIGFSAALNLSVKEDFGLGVAGILSAAILLFRKSRSQRA